MQIDGRAMDEGVISELVEGGGVVSHLELGRREEDFKLSIFGADTTNIIMKEREGAMVVGS